MNKKTLIIGAVGIVLLGVAFSVFGGNSQGDNDTNKNNITSATLAPSQEQRIVINGHKIQGGEITVPVGTTVVFENQDDFPGLPYDAHTITTGSVDGTGSTGIPGIVPNSGSGEPDGLIDAPLKLDESFSFTFAEPGSFSFYVAEHPLVSGQGEITVTVVEETVVGESVIKMDSDSFSFAPAVIQAQVGEPVRIDVASEGEHTFTIDELGVNVFTPNDKTTRVEFTPEKAGTFEFYCAVPGHREAGQVGTIVVQ